MVQWKALESNPESINAFLGKLSVKGVECVDVLSFDPDMIAFVPAPQLAVILCFPPEGEDFMKKLYADRAAAEESKAPPEVFFMKQKIGNACGTFALFHSLANLENVIDIGNGAFRKWLNKAKALSADERSQLLEEDGDLAAAHDETAQSGETDEPDNVEHHFICYVARDGVLYEIDSVSDGPRSLGPTTPETLVADAGKTILQLAANVGTSSFAAMALVGN